MIRGTNPRPTSNSSPLRPASCQEEADVGLAGLSSGPGSATPAAAGTPTSTGTTSGSAEGAAAMPVGNSREDGDGVATTAAGGSGGGGTLVASCTSDEANASRVIAILVLGRPAEMDPDPDPGWLLPSELLAAALGRNGSGEDASRPAESLTGAAAPALLLAAWPRKEPPLPRKDPTPPAPPDPVVPLLLPPLPRLRKEPPPPPPGVRLRRLPLPMWLEKSGSSALAAMAASRSASEGTLRVRVMTAARVRSSMRDCEGGGRTGHSRVIRVVCCPHV